MRLSTTALVEHRSLSELEVLPRAAYGAPLLVPGACTCTSCSWGCGCSSSSSSCSCCAAVNLAEGP